MSIAQAAARDDRILPLTRVVAAGVILILLLAVLALYFFPDRTAENFAWTIQPRMTAMAMGAGYLMGAYFFARVLTGSRWHRVAAGFLPITAFTIGMALATILHLDRFHAGQWNAILWEVVYAITPFLVPLIWYLNQRHDPGTPEPDDVVVPALLRRAVGLAGIAALIASILVLLQPQLAMGIWPWMLTPLTARVLGGWLLLPAIGGLYLMRESRWSGWSVLVETATVASAFVLLAVVISWNDWQPSNLLTPLFVAAMVATLVGMPTLYWFMRSRRPRLAAARS
jgi:hypothetical protein